MKQRPIFWLIKKMRRHLPALMLMTLVHAGQAVLGVLFVLKTREVIDCAVDKAVQPFYSACLQQGMVIVGILVCLTLFRHLKEWMSAELDRNWKQELLHGLLHGEYTEVSKFHSGELLNRMNNDVRVVDEGILTILPSIVGLLTRLCAAAWVLFTLDFAFALMIACLGVFVIVVTGVFRGRLKELHKKVSEQDGIVLGFLQETIEKLLVVQAMDVSIEVEHRADLLLEKRVVMQHKRKNIALAANTGVSVMSYGAGFLALVWCAYKVLQGTMSLGTLTAVTQLVSQLRSPFVGLSGVYPKYISMIASAERLMELESIASEVPVAAKDLDNVYNEMKSISGHDLYFSYGRDDVLCGASFELNKDSFAVITGASGIGKSTLLKLLLGVYSPDGGQLTVNLDSETIKLDRSMRGLFAYVPQGNCLFSGTIRENLMLVKPDASEEEISMAVYVSAMDEFLGELDAGLDTFLGENGSGLSEGQAQRVAIARAIVGGAKILLLDECTSALDSQTERVVLERLKRLSDRTILAVTHRKAAIDLCDVQFEVSKGRLLMTLHQEDELE